MSLNISSTHPITAVTTPHGCHEVQALAVYHWINFVVITLVAVVGIISQFVVIAVIHSFKKKTSTDIFLYALSLLDVFVIISLSVTENGSIYTHILSPGKQILNAAYISVAAHPFEHMAHFASTWCIVLMSTDRYLSICHPTLARAWCTPQRAKLQLFVLFIIVSVYSIPRFLEYYVVLPELEHFINRCDGELHDYPEGSLGRSDVYIWGYTFIAYLIIMYIVPLGTLCFTNYHLIRIIRTRIHFHKNRNKQASREDLTSKKTNSENSPSKFRTKILPRLLRFNRSKVEPIETVASRLPDVVTNHQVPPEEPEVEQPGQVQCGSTLKSSNNNKTISFLVEEADSTGSSEPMPVVVNMRITNNNKENHHSLRKSNPISISTSSDIIRTSTLTNPRDRFIKRQYDHVIRMLITVTVVFSICQIPDMLIQLISRLYVSWELSEELRIIAYDFVIINSSINLFIYTVTSQRFKRQLLKRFKCLNRGNDKQLSNGQTTLDLS